MSTQAAVATGSRPTLAITCGEPAGIGPEISIKAAWALRDEVRAVLLGDAAFLSQTAQMLDPAIAVSALSQQAFNNTGLPDFPANRLIVVDCPVDEPIVPGILDARNGRAVLKTLDVAIAGTLSGQFDAMVTAPLQKSTINDAGVAFTGHTEYLAERTNTEQVVMMLAGGQSPHLRVALATTHLALRDVADAITFDSLTRVIDIIDTDLRSKFGIAEPRILVTGLNPHAGENGYLGREEINVITPALDAARQRGINVEGPYPADTLFQQKYLEHADCVLAMYHDQGLPVLKFASFGQGVNITLGLPLIRTSVDHGTALDLATQGLGHADHGSMIEAIKTAALMVRAKKSL
ncbi:4-hydroxythreonine-4-phosphate dehydrogenase [Herbaspirillum sp. Sphag1AN]|uniref:4-hydroxythreonine-4-phosphate dehydrogenase PdxA n=1 Tax=unclassified Herbaspirillum TaxID=2624150 RepID=UPI00161AD09C|nr:MULTISPECIES: 4-hydroxythreonine-4-phosphate dehydrogenase PdxA [unclassified Herbaspirillum]MBB3214251.1 4-hydroxythreonine-4-phosphate dehydrogenase [Herbaspirillum sp. Sphag1AN]MBB3247197.1 4-hydroxythreonine-4-phosphate dehydrogenase [Herbaspirillum sp. Sphag64]